MVVGKLDIQFSPVPFEAIKRTARHNPNWLRDHRCSGISKAGNQISPSATVFGLVAEDAADNALRVDNSVAFSFQTPFASLEIPRVVAPGTSYLSI
jgi:hypothetical protein